MADGNQTKKIVKDRTGSFDNPSKWCFMQEPHYTIRDHSSTECGRRFVFNNGWQPLLEGTEEIDLQRCDEDYLTCSLR